MFKEFAQLRIVRIVRPHWKVLSLALLAVVGETVADIVEPWPISIVVDNVLQGKRLHGTLEAFVAPIFGQNSASLLAFALALVLTVAIVGGISAYVEKYLTTSVSQWVAHDMRLLLYQRIQRLSLAEHGKARAGDLLIARHEGHRRDPGLHRHGAARHRRRVDDARRDGRRHAVGELALHAGWPFDRARAVRVRLLLLDAGSRKRRGPSRRRRAS